MNRPIQPDLHPDADSLNAFVERTLPEPEHELVLEHMAGCARCRDIVYLARQMAEAEAEAKAEAGAEAALSPSAEVKAAPRGGWWSPVFAPWRIAWIPAVVLAAVGGILIWVHIRSAQPAIEMARIAPRPALPASTPPPFPATARSVASPSPSELEARRAEEKASTNMPGMREKKRLQWAAKSDRQADQIAQADMRAQNAPFPLAQPVQSAKSAAAQVVIAPPLADTRWLQPAETVPMTTNRSISAGPAQTPASAGVLAVHGGPMPAPTAGPTLLAGEAPQPLTRSEPAPQPVNGLAALRLTRRLKLPSGLATVSSAAMLNRLLVIDSAGTLFLSTDAGKHWDAVPIQWTGKAIEVRAQPPTLAVSSAEGELHAAAAAQVAPAPPAHSDAESATALPPAPGPEPVPAMLFRLMNDRRRIWISADGKTWHEEPD